MSALWDTNCGTTKGTTRGREKGVPVDGKNKTPRLFQMELSVRALAHYLVRAEHRCLRFVKRLLQYHSHGCDTCQVDLYGTITLISVGCQAKTVTVEFDFDYVYILLTTLTLLIDAPHLASQTERPLAQIMPIHFSNSTHVAICQDQTETWLQPKHDGLAAKVRIQGALKDLR